MATSASDPDAPADGRCQAVAKDTGERCRHSAIPGVPYCHDHYHLLDGGLDEHLGPG